MATAGFVWPVDLAGLALGALGLVAAALVLRNRRLQSQIRDSEARLASASAASEVELRRLNRLYSALSQINQAIVASRTREELFDRVCRILVERGEFLIAWIGWHDPEQARLMPVAQWGDTDGYLDSIRIYTDERPESRGPSAAAFREGRPNICEDMLNDPVMAPWQEEVRRRAIRACAVFPIRLAGETGGVLTVYVHEPRFFQDKEIALLSEAAADISFALDNFVREDERRHSEAVARSEKFFSDTMIESMPGVVYFYDENGKFLRWNRNLEIVSGYSRDEVSQMHPLDFFASDDRDGLQHAIAEVFATGEAMVEMPFRNKNGETIPYFFTGRQITFGGAPCLVGVGIDISERKRAEIELRELNGSLERRVVERTGQLQAALGRAEAADRTKSAFLANMSHEFRTPLNSIIGFTGIVLQGLAGPLNPEQTKQLGMVRGSARHLLELINDVLDISKIEAGELSVRNAPFDVQPSIERVVASIRPLAEGKGLQLDVSQVALPLRISSDQRRVEQILLNLLNNAIKFTEAGTVTLTVDTVPLPAPGAIRFQVRDTGIGIKPEDLVQLFQPFRQIETGLSRQHEGTGLGLAICRRLADLLDGEIQVDSEWGRGSVFAFTLPAKEGALHA